MTFIQITDLNDKRVEIYTKYNENQLFHYAEPKEGIFIAETPMVIERALEKGYVPLSYFVEEHFLNSETFKSLLKSDDKIDVFYAPLDVINKITGFNLTRGVLCAMQREKLDSLDKILKNSKRIVILENTQNPTNVGAIFRSAAALGVDGVLLTNDSADPLYRRAARVSMGTVFQIPWSYLPDDYMEIIKCAGFKTVAMALDTDSITITDVSKLQIDKLAIIMGTESTGIKEDTLRECDYKTIIPMYHGVDSLNVSCASAIAIWELCK